MDRNTEYQNAGVATLSYERSTHQDIYQHKTTFNVGQLVPFFVDTLAQPGDTYSMSTSIVLRLTTPYFPTMDNLYADIYYFYVPYTILWTHAKEFWGENKLGAWTQTVEYKIPEIKTTNVAVTTHSILDHFGWRKGVKGIHGSRLALSAYFEAWNQFFRDQTVSAPIQYDMGDTDIEYDGSTEKGGTMLNVYKFHDYFTSLLPEPQKGTQQTIPLGSTAPVTVYGNGNGMRMEAMSSSGKITRTLGQMTNNNVGIDSAIVMSQTFDAQSVENGTVTTGLQALTTSTPVGLATAQTYGTSGIVGLADLANATAAAINALRLKIAVQHILERDAIYGTRLQEIYRAHWGVTAPADLMQIPEYLGGKRVPINMETVLQTSSTDATSPQGNTGAFSVTADSDFSFTKSIYAHGVILGLICVRQDHTYAQRMDAKWNKLRKFDFYWNEFKNLGYQPVLKKEICATGTATDEQVLAYKQPWQEYRVWTNDVTGELNPDYQYSLDAWTYVDDFANAPTYSKEFLEETPTNVDRTIVVPSSTQDQFICDIACNITKVSEVPQYGIPGLMNF